MRHHSQIGKSLAGVCVLVASAFGGRVDSFACVPVRSSVTPGIRRLQLCAALRCEGLRELISQEKDSWERNDLPDGNS